MEQGFNDGNFQRSRNGMVIKTNCMRIQKKQIKIGSRVRLLDDIEMFDCIYTKGHEFTVYGSSCRGWDLVDDDGNKLDECLFIHDKLELING